MVPAIGKMTHRPDTNGSDWWKIKVNTTFAHTYIHKREERAKFHTPSKTCKEGKLNIFLLTLWQ